MADFDSSLPIRTEADGDVVVKVADATVPSQQLEVDSGGRVTSKISDGTDLLAINADGSVNITDNGGSLTVDATNLDIRDLVFATDKVDASGSTVALDAPTLAALESITVQNGAGASAVNIQDGGNSITVDATDLDIRDLTHASDSVKVGDGTDFLAVSADGSIAVNIRDESGSAFSASNPLPVTLVDSEGTEVNNYNTASAVAAGGTSNHDYTVTGGTTLKLSQIWASASGKMKIEVQIETGVATGVFNTRFVGFNSTSNPNIEVPIRENISVAAGVRVRVIRTNKDNQAQDLYSTISGHEI